MALQAFYKRLYWFGIGFAMTLKLALVGWWPSLARMHEKTDSALFIRQSISILEGDWLGPYNFMTLMKGPMTPIWIALTNYLGWPVNFAREALYLGACLLALKALSLFCRSRWLLLVFFYFLVLFPAAASYGPLAALFRESIQLPLVLGIQALLIILFAKYAQSKDIHVYETVLLGIFLLAFFLNREESPWIYPQLLMLSIGVVAIGIWRYRQPGISLRGMSLLKLFLIPALIVGAGIEWVSNKNLEEYGVDAVLEINRPEFRAAYKGLMRIKPEVPVKGAEFTPDMLEKLSSLQKGKELNRPPLAPGVRLAMLVPWHFRSAVEGAGYYEQGGAAVLAFYKELAEEMEAACDTGQYECRPVLFGVIPLVDGFWSRVYSAALDRPEDITTLHGVDPDIKQYPGFSNASYRRNLSWLTSAPIAVAAEDRRTLPKYYARTEKNKTKALKDILSFYISVLPTLTGFAAFIFAIALVLSAWNRRAGLQEFLFLGLFGTLFTQVAIYSLLWASGLSFSSRLYYNTYPVLILFICMAIIYLGRIWNYRQASSLITQQK